MRVECIGAVNTRVAISLPTGGASTTSIYRFHVSGLPAMICPTPARLDPEKTQQLVARVDELERLLAEVEHQKEVKRATLASTASLRAAWADDDESEL